MNLVHTITYNVNGESIGFLDFIECQNYYEYLKFMKKVMKIDLDTLSEEQIIESYREVCSQFSIISYE